MQSLTITNTKTNENKLGNFSSALEIFNSDFETKCIIVDSIPEEITLLNLDNISITSAKNIANTIFLKYNTNNILNDNNTILISKTGINESVEKIYNNRTQRKLFREHLIIIANLKFLLNKAKLVNQAYEKKSRANIKMWNYYFLLVKFNICKYKILIDVRCMQNGELQYGVQRLMKYEKAE